MKPNSSSTSSSENQAEALRERSADADPGNLVEVPLGDASDSASVAEPAVAPPGPQSGFRLRRHRRNVIPALAWTLVWLAVLDVGIGLVTRPEPNPHIEPSGWPRYFDYGRSVESKLRYMVRSTPQTSAPVALAGWLATPQGVDPYATVEPAHASDSNHVLVATYGQSFMIRAKRNLPEVDSRFEPRFQGGPAAPLSHSFALYEADRTKQDAQVVVLGVLASSFTRLVSLTNMTLWFEEPQPATYPRYYLQDGHLEAIEPSIRSFPDLQAALRDPVRWKRFVDQLSRYDAAYDPFVFEQSILDASTMGRALRRAFGQRHVKEFNARYMDANGFTNRDGLIDVAEAILAEFGATARKDGRLPYVLLFSDFGYGNDLARALGPGLERHGIPYLSSDTVVDPNDPTNYVADGHFRPDLDRAFVIAWVADMRKHLAELPTSAHAELNPSPKPQAP